MPRVGHTDFLIRKQRLSTAQLAAVLAVVLPLGAVTLVAVRASSNPTNNQPPVTTTPSQSPSLSPSPSASPLH